MLGSEWELIEDSLYSDKSVDLTEISVSVRKNAEAIEQLQSIPSTLNLLMAQMEELSMNDELQSVIDENDDGDERSGEDGSSSEKLLGNFLSF